MSLEQLTTIPFLGPLLAAVATIVFGALGWVLKRHFAYGERIAKLERSVKEQSVNKKVTDAKILDLEDEMTALADKLRDSDQRIESKIDKMAGCLETHIEAEEERTNLVLEQIKMVHSEVVNSKKS